MTQMSEYIGGIRFPFKLCTKNGSLVKTKQGEAVVQRDRDGCSVYVLPGGVEASREQVVTEYLPKGRRFHVVK